MLKFISRSLSNLFVFCFGLSSCVSGQLHSVCHTNTMQLTEQQVITQVADLMDRNHNNIITSSEIVLGFRDILGVDCETIIFLNFILSHLPSFHPLCNDQAIFTCSFTTYLFHSLIHLLTHFQLCLYSFSLHSLTYSHNFNHFLTHSLVHPRTFTHLFTHSPFHSIIIIYLSNHSFTHSSTSLRLSHSGHG